MRAMILIAFVLSLSAETVIVPQLSPSVERFMRERSNDGKVKIPKLTVLEPGQVGRLSPRVTYFVTKIVDEHSVLAQCMGFSAEPGDLNGRTLGDLKEKKPSKVGHEIAFTGISVEGLAVGSYLNAGDSIYEVVQASMDDQPILLVRRIALPPTLSEDLDLLGNPVQADPKDSKANADVCLKQARDEAKNAIKLAREYQTKAKAAGQELTIAEILASKRSFQNKKKPGEDFVTMTDNAEVIEAVEKINNLRDQACTMLRAAGVNAVQSHDVEWIIENRR